MVFSNKPLKIDEQLYLGNFSAADYDTLKSYNISAVVCLTNDSHDYPEEIDLFHINDISENLIEDTFSLDKLESALSFINNKITNGQNVLVHCMAGASRSPTVIIAYIIEHKGMQVLDACNYVKQKAPHINPTFMDLLEEFYYKRHSQE